MPADKQITCRISWDDILSSSNPEQLIFRTLQLEDVDAYVNNGRFEPATGRLHFVDDVTTRERIYVWCPERDAYPLCNCIMCEDKRTMTHFTLDFKCQLIQELYDCGAGVANQLRYEKLRVHEIVQREREIEDRRKQDREREERRRRDQELEQQRQLQAQEHRRELRRIQGLEREAQKQAKKQEEEPIAIRVQEVQQVRQVRLED